MKKIPNHIAVIFDGNGRWAKLKGLPRSLGHKAGAKPVEEIIRECSKLGVKVLTIYTFSTENWNRSCDEVDYLMKLFAEFFIKLQKEAGREIRVNHLGTLDNLSEELICEIKRTEKLTEDNKGMILNVALNYGGRLEITQAAEGILKDVNDGKLSIHHINEDVVNNYMFKKLPDVDLLIRTSGEKRLSNFMLWQCAKAKIFVTEKLWPDFTKECLMEAIDFYNG